MAKDLKEHLKRIEKVTREELEYYKCPVDTPWVLSLDLDDTILRVWRDDPELDRIAQLTYGKIENPLTPEQILQNQIKVGGIQIGDELACVHKIIPDDFLSWAFKTFDVIGIYSSATKEYIELVTPVAYPDLLSQVDFVLDRESCFYFKHYLAKDLKRVAELDSKWHLGRILHVDDNRFAFPQTSNFMHSGKGYFDYSKESLNEVLTYDNLLEYSVKKRLDHERENFDPTLYCGKYDGDLDW